VWSVSGLLASRVERNYSDSRTIIVIFLEWTVRESPWSASFGGQTTAIIIITTVSNRNKVVWLGHDDRRLAIQLSTIGIQFARKQTIVLPLIRTWCSYLFSFPFPVIRRLTRVTGIIERGSTSTHYVWVMSASPGLRLLSSSVLGVTLNCIHMFIVTGKAANQSIVSSNKLSRTFTSSALLFIRPDFDVSFSLHCYCRRIHFISSAVRPIIVDLVYYIICNKIYNTIYSRAL